MDGWNGHGGRRPRIWLGCARGQGCVHDEGCVHDRGCAYGERYGIGLVEGAATGVGGIECGRAHYVAQPGMVTGAHFRFLRIEGLPGLLELVVCSTMQSGGDGGVGVRAGGQREAEE
jgi:hypothetical protein